MVRISVTRVAGERKVWGACSPEEEERYKPTVRDREDDSHYYLHMGLVVTGLGNGWATIEMPVGERFWNPGGIVHGGAIMSVADAAAGVALFTLLDEGKETAITIELKINFCAPVSEGTLEGRGRVVQKGKRIAVCEVDVTGDGGVLVAKGLSTYTLLGR